jgi:copper(I)-binding protein
MNRVVLAAFLLASGAAFAADPSPVQVEHAWSRATPGSSRIGVVYLVLRDAAASDMLTGASTPVAGRATLHESYREGGLDKMRMLEGVMLPRNKEVAFAPGGRHIMLMDLKQPLKVGETFPLTLEFAHAAPVTATVTVLPVGAPGPAGADETMPGMVMPGMEMNKTQ